MSMTETVQPINPFPVPSAGASRQESRANRPGPREEAFSELEAGVLRALETYSNVHRGTGYNSLVTTRLYERAREVILDALDLDKALFTAVFCTPDRASSLEARLRPGTSLTLSSREIGLPLGIVALAVRKAAFPPGVPFQTGGGTTRIVSRRSVVWEDAPDKFEAGTPAVINAVALALAAQIVRRRGAGVFKVRDGWAGAAARLPDRDGLERWSGRELLGRLRASVIGAGRQVPTANGSESFVYLDNAASTPALEPVWRAFSRAWRQTEDEQGRLVARAKAACARFFGAPLTRYEMIFTSNTTEAINLAALSLENEPPREPAVRFEPVILNTLMEHNSNELPWRFAKGVSLVRTPVDGDGFPDMNVMERLLREYNADRAHGRKRIRVVAVSGASNVLGTCPDLREISRISHMYGARILVDAAQLAAHRKIDMEADDLDYLAFSGHKMYAPFGSGGLVARKGLLVSASEDLESIKASGEENAAGIAALGKAVELLGRVGMDVIGEEERKLTGKALRELAAIPGIEVYGIKDPDSPRFERRGGVISFGLKRVPHNLVAEKLAGEGGIGVRDGCFCAHILVKRVLGIPPVREALADAGLRLAPRLTKSLLPGLVRVSFGIENDERDIGRLVNALKRIVAERVCLRDRLLARTHNATPVVPETDARRRMRASAEREVENVLGPAPRNDPGVSESAPVFACHSSSPGINFLGRPCCRRS
ncbi:MAG: aminotransferase class V-fold PLP-dependent enzyme [Candidatus Aminicenantales bacterium]